MAVPLPSRPVRKPLLDVTSFGDPVTESNSTFAPGTRDWTNLLRLVQRALPALQQALLSSASPLLVVNAGLLARYGLLGLVSELEQAAGRPGHTPAAWLMLPGHRPGTAEIDGTPVPLVYANAVAALTPTWINNEHRSLGAVA